MSEKILTYINDLLKYEEPQNTQGIVYQYWLLYNFKDGIKEKNGVYRLDF